jgi:iron complex transport system ATP-binding protein
MAEMAAHPVELRNITYSVNGTKILRNLSWTIAEGEHWAVVGPNGAGKTTLLRIIAGDLWPNGAGRVYRNGKSRFDLGTLRRGIGWLTASLTEEIPKREAVLDTVISGKYGQRGFWPFAWEPPAQQDFEGALRLLSALGCEGLAQRTFGSLSQGEQQKVLVCRALMAQPYLLVLDEPCAGMDPQGRELFLAGLSRLCRDGKSPNLLYVTHHVEEILPAFTKTLALKEGATLKCGPTGEILTAETMKEIYGVSISLVCRKGRYWPIVD